MERGKREKTSRLVSVLFMIYLALLVWIILFKLQFSVSAIDKIRNVNLIPFYYADEIGTRLHVTEVLENVLIFIPFGIYLCMLKREPCLKMKFGIIFLSSLALEIFQYILAVGWTDVTDLMTNTCGGMAGVGFYWLAVKVFGSRRRAELIITVFAAAVTAAVTALLAVLLISNG